MNFQATKIGVQYDAQMHPQIVLTATREALTAVDAMREQTDKGKQLDVEIKVHRQKRSLNANAYFWALVGKMAGVLRTDKDAVYLDMLKHYGQFTYVICKPEAVGRMRETFRLLEEVGPTKTGGGIQMLVFYGSHTYDTQEMAILIDGAISEAKALGIDTATPEEIALMKEKWSPI